MAVEEGEEMRRRVLENERKEKWPTEIGVRRFGVDRIARKGNGDEEIGQW